MQFLSDGILDDATNAELNGVTTAGLEAAGEAIDCLVDVADGVVQSEKDVILTETQPQVDKS